MIAIDKSLNSRKSELLTHFSDRGAESLQEIKSVYGSTQFKALASAINKAIIETRDNVIKALEQKANKEKWDNRDLLEYILMITYTSYIVMIEYRNGVWPYEYMTFSRRIGELWQPFCRLCFEYPLKEMSLFIPPLFSEVKRKLSSEIGEYIERLNISEEQKRQLKKYYEKVWSLVTSGEIKLELDLHFEQGVNRYVVDFKSGFGSNEKGNTNRLLLVAAIYKNLEENYKCLLLVRADEDSNNNYFRILKNSGVWEAYCGKEAYARMKEHTGFDIKQWIETNIDWTHDFRDETIQYFRENNFDQYLKW